MKKVFTKIAANNKGETITETLVSVLIITLAMTMLAGGIVSASKVNRKVRDADTAFNADEIESPPPTGTVSLKHADGSSDTTAVTVNITKDNNAYVYYEKNP